MAGIQDLSDSDFGANVLESARGSLVDFWGDHCPACRQISPILKQLAEEYSGRVDIWKCHAVENARTASQYGVRAMPTVLAFRGGTVVGQLVGARPKKDFEELISKIL